MKDKFNIGVVGYSAQNFNEIIAKALIIKAFDQIQDKYQDKEFVVVSGLTDVGIPALAYREATRRGWETIGVACEKAKEYKLYSVDETKIVGKEWGDESETFISMIDIFVKIGGGKQSQTEKEKAESKDIPVIDFNLASTEKAG